MTQPQPSADDHNFTPYGITRPDRRLLTYYLIVSGLSGPLFPIVFLPLCLKYGTLQYRFDQEGISMSWGLLFRKEVVLTYRRIQDIHLTRNVVQRWLGLALVAVQTASGAAGAELTVEGILEAEPLRNFLYQRMRGAKGLDEGRDTRQCGGRAAVDSDEHDEGLMLLREICDSLQQVARGSGAMIDGGEVDDNEPRQRA